jgi:hypothetical protein
MAGRVVVEGESEKHGICFAPPRKESVMTDGPGESGAPDLRQGCSIARGRRDATRREEAIAFDSRYAGRNDAEYTSFSGQQQHDSKQKTAVPPMQVSTREPWRRSQLKEMRLQSSPRSADAAAGTLGATLPQPNCYTASRWRDLGLTRPRAH